MCERELETEQNCNILTPTLLAITAFLSRSPGLLNRGPNLSGTCSLIHHLLLTGLVSKQINRESEGSLCWVLAFSTASGLQTDWIFCALRYIIVQRIRSSCGRHNRTHSTRPLSRLYSDITWVDVPVIYTGAFPILTARPGRRSIYNTNTFEMTSINLCDKKRSWKKTRNHWR